MSKFISAPNHHDDKGKLLSSERPKYDQTSSRWFDCHKIGHYSYECPKRNMVIQLNEEGLEEVEHVVDKIASDEEDLEKTHYENNNALLQNYRLYNVS